ncbi:MAG TPA: hypothetical protein VH081_02215 [Solirubrobacteraceae bacterium]|jgi:hypothetical protein|nr:hypothetical protein [Solirubrobacteraceae bacterium]
MDSTARLSARRIGCAAFAAACVLALGASGSASAQSGDSPSTTTPGSSGVSATLEACVTSVVQGERSVTFNGEMTAIAGTAKMSMRIDLEERTPEETEFHEVIASGLGVWRPADPKVKIYKYVKQVSNLTSPASYRALIRFRWFSSTGHVIKRSERVTARCLQPATPSEATAPSAGGSGAVTSPPTASTPSD